MGALLRSLTVSVPCLHETPGQWGSWGRFCAVVMSVPICVHASHKYSVMYVHVHVCRWVAAGLHAAALRKERRGPPPSLSPLPQPHIDLAAHPGPPGCSPDSRPGGVNGAETSPCRSQCKPPCVREARCVTGMSQLLAPSSLICTQAAGEVLKFSGGSLLSSESPQHFPQRVPNDGATHTSQAR